MVTRLKNQFEPLAKEKKLAMIVDLAPTLPKKIKSDGRKIEQIVKNLLSNAIKFTSKGQIKLSINVQQVGSEWSKSHQNLQFQVADTGIGIDRSKSDQVFEAFYQVDASTSRRYGGTGLGLSISRKLARLLGGEIYLEEKSNEPPFGFSGKGRISLRRSG